MFCDYDQYKDKEIVQRHEKLLRQLGERDRVFSLEWYGENITLMECCDYCFGHDLTKADCMELSELFRELAEELGQIKQHNREGKAGEQESYVQHRA